MHIFYLLTTILILQCPCLFGQQIKLYPFRIDGAINTDADTIYLKSIAGIYCYPKDALNLSAKISNKRFSIEGYLPHPEGVYLSVGNYQSSTFVIEQGEQSITVNVNSDGEIPRVDNFIMKNDYFNFRNAYKQYKLKDDSLSREWDSLRTKFQDKIPAAIQAGLESRLNESYRESDRTLLEYVSSHPDSYFAFWRLIGLMRFGYENIFDSIFSKFSDSLKNTYAGKVLSKELKIAGKLGIGKEFPIISCINIENQKLHNSVFLNNKYTLVDFWYSNCNPCRRQFPDLKVVYQKYKSKGFEIIGISTDQLAHKNDWLNAIVQDQISWLQYWDINGKETANLSIVAFPTNFLLDSNGKIIRKNIRPAELGHFLSENLKK